MEGNPTSRGLSGDELERQLREEEEKLAVSPEGLATKPEEKSDQEEAFEDAEANQEQVEEEGLSADLEVLQQQAANIEAAVAEIGGVEKVKEILESIPPAELTVLNAKMEAQRKVIETSEKTLERSVMILEMVAEPVYRPDLSVKYAFEEHPLKGVAAVAFYPVIVTFLAMPSMVQGIAAIRDKIKLNSEKRKLKRMERAVK